MTRSKDEQAELARQLVEAYQAGASLKDLERRFDVAASYAGRLIKRAGVELRPPGRERPDAYGDTLGRNARHDFQSRIRETYWKRR